MKSVTKTATKKNTLPAKIISWGLFFLFVIAVEWFWGWRSILSPWKDISYTQMFTGLSLLFTGYAVRALRLYDYFYPDTRWWASVRLLLLNNFLNNLLPARTGEVSFVLLMKRYFQVDYLHSMPALLWFRILDLYMLLTVAAIVWFVQSDWPWFMVCLLGLWVLLPFGFYLLQNQFEKWLLLKQQGCVGEKTQKVIQLLLNMVKGLPRNNLHFLKNWGLTALNWLVKLLTLAWFMSIFLPLEWKYLITAVVTGELTSVLPIHTPGGFGTYEAGVMSVLVSLTDKNAAANAAINLHLLVLGSAALGGALGWLIPHRAGTIEQTE